ncbi:MAG: helix-turn-helix domain-containing protein [Streptosporangiaceae bacterium]
MKTTPKRGLGRRLARVPQAPTSGATGRSDGQTLAELLRRLRTEHGLSSRRLAVRAGVARSTVQRLKRGQLRPRPSTLGWIAGAIDLDRRKEIRDALVAAAGDELAPHSEAWSRYRVRRMNERLHAGLAPVPVPWDRQIRRSRSVRQCGMRRWRSTTRPPR